MVSNDVVTTHIGVGILCGVIGFATAANDGNRNERQLLSEFDALIAQVQDDHTVELDAAKAESARLDGLNEGLMLAIDVARQQPVVIQQEGAAEQQPVVIQQEGTAEQQRAVTVNVGMTDFLAALREEADMLMSFDELHDGAFSMWDAANIRAGSALSRVHNRVVNDCEYETYHHSTRDDGTERYAIRRIDLDCADR